MLIQALSLSCICVGCCETVEKSIKGNTAFTESGWVLKRQKCYASMGDSHWTRWLVSAGGHDRHMVHSTDGEIQHQWLQISECVIKTCVP